MVNHYLLGANRLVLCYEFTATNFYNIFTRLSQLQYKLTVLCNIMLHSRPLSPHDYDRVLNTNICVHFTCWFRRTDRIPQFIFQH